MCPETSGRSGAWPYLGLVDDEFVWAVFVGGPLDGGVQAVPAIDGWVFDPSSPHFVDEAQPQPGVDSPSASSSRYELRSRDGGWVLEYLGQVGGDATEI